MAQRSFRWLLLGLAATGFLADQASKFGVFRWLAADTTLRGESDVLPGWFKFTAEFDPTVPPDAGTFGAIQTWSAPLMPRVNHGALFGLGNEHKGLANQVFAGISFLAAVGICVWGVRRSTAADRWLCVALGLILGGTVGNLVDRVVFHGVRDFLYFYKVEWPVFNVADCCLVCGAGVLLVHAFRTPVAEPAATVAA